MPKVSVVIPVYNAELYIERCVRSLFEQTLDDIEYIFVDDCSSDNSLLILNRLIEEFPKRKSQVMILYHSENTGQSGARRDGMRAASGDYIIHCDSDDWVELDMYEKMYNKAITTGADAVCCDMVMEFTSSQTYLKYNSDFSDHQLMYDCIAPISVEYFSMCNRLISRKVLDRNTIEPFEGVNMWDDVGLSTRFRYYIQGSVVINEPLYHYNRQNDASTTRRPVLEKVQEMVDCVKQLEMFYYNEGVAGQYIRFIALLKLIAKHDLFHMDFDRWKNVFPDAHRYIYILKVQYGLKAIIKLYMYACCERIAKVIARLKRRR